MNAKPVCLLLGLAAVSMAAEAPGPKVVLPEQMAFATPPTIPDLKTAWVLGAENQAGPYVIRVVLKAGGRVAAHSHPDTRHSTVLSGTLYVGFGDSANTARMTAVPSGAVYVAPANTPHFLWAKDGEVVYQEAGVGPTGTRMIVSTP